MKKYYSRVTGAKAIRALVLSLFLSATLISCEKINNSLGTDFIPDDQIMLLRRDSSFQIKTYNVTGDSVYSAQNELNYFGSYVNEVTGSVNASFIFQMRPPFQGTDSTFDKNAVIDSAFIYFLLYQNTLGKSEVEQTFEMYELKEQVYADSIYYSNFDPTPLLENAPLFTFTHSGEEGMIKYEIKDEAFLNRLLDTTGYSQDTLFYKRFKGFYVKPQQANKDAAIYAVTLNNSSLQVYYHNDQTKPDTSYRTSYPFAVTYTDSYTGSTYSFGNQSINMVDFDYTHADPALRLNDTIQPASRTYIQAYGGMQTYLEFTQESIDAMRKKVKEAGFKDIAINKAKLQVYYPLRDPDELDNAFYRLGMYYNYSKGEPIPDLNLVYEQYYSTYSTYGGIINRSRYMYEMDVTMYVQRLFREDADPAKQWVFLGPSYGTLVNNSLTLTEPLPLDGYGSETPLRLILTYTMIR